MRISAVLTLSNYRAIRVILGVILMLCCAQISIPLNPVQISLYSVGVMIISLCYNKQEAMQSIVTYVALGAIGLPVFNGFRGGLAVLLSPTGGYIMGFILCVYVVTTMREKFGEKSWLHLIAYSLVGTCCVYLLGLTQLTYFVGSFAKAIEVGLMPFILTGTIKALFTASSIRLIKKNL